MARGVDRGDARPAEGRAAPHAFAAHLFTAAGGGIALLAMMAAVERRWTPMFAWLGLALLLDGVDGTIARWLDVKRRVPRWSGDILDLVVDILTYVFVPAYAILTGGFLPPGIATALGLLIVVTGVLYFADRGMKSDDNYFFGFPAVWNVVAFYLHLLGPAQWLAAILVVALAAATFLPVPFLHPFRVVRFRWLNVSLTAAWGILAALAVAADLRPAMPVTLGLCAVALYFVCAGAFRGRGGAGAERP